MNDKHVLFIEDGDITEQVDKLRKLLQKNGITLIEKILDLSDGKFRVNNPSNPDETVLNITEIKNILRDDFINERFDYVLCDFDFADKNLDGFQLIKWLKNVSIGEKKRLRHAKFSLYSSEPEKFLKKHVSVEDLSDLIKLKLSDFYSRTSIGVDFGSYVLNSNEEINLKAKLITELSKYGDMKFRSVYPKFNGMALGEIVTEIENDTHHSRFFQEHLIELTVAHLIDLNNEDK